MSITIEEYSSRAIQTAQYPNKGKNLIYTVFGLIDEFGEAVEKMEHVPTIDINFWDFIDEMGDMLWYFNQTHYEFDQQYKTIDSFPDLIKRTKCSPSYCLAYDINQNLIIKNLIINMSKLAGVMKKAVRDNKGKIQKEKIELFIINYKESLRWYQIWIDYINTKNSNYTNLTLTIETIGAKNITKLEDRAARGVIKGDGDKR